MTYLEEYEMDCLRIRKDIAISVGLSLPPTDQDRLTALERKYYKELSSDTSSNWVWLCKGCTSRLTNAKSVCHRCGGKGEYVNCEDDTDERL